MKNTRLLKFSCILSLRLYVEKKNRIAYILKKSLIIMWYEILLENLMIPFQKCV